MTAMFPFGRRRLVVTVTAEPTRPRTPELDAAVCASDAELARLAKRRDLDQARWDVWAVLHGSPR